ncbi:MAG: carbonic anhydrase [Gammaproteobacteria bacterium]|nr:carbonic anhydrase [Gammaproteobacteria bacterium]
MEPIERLLDGHQRFRNRFSYEQSSLLKNLATQGQSPDVAIVSCCDSRVDPAIIFDCKPGDLFIVRNVANLVPPYEPEGTYHGTSAALEFAVNGLNVSHIIVLGHAQCGGVQALLRENDEDAGKSDFIHNWMSIAKEAAVEVANDKTLTTEAERCRQCERAVVNVSLNNLMSFPWIKKRVEENQLHLHGWYFDLEVGDLIRLGLK